MTAVSWRDGAQELRRLVVAENGVPNRIEDVDDFWTSARSVEFAAEDLAEELVMALNGSAR